MDPERLPAASDAREGRVMTEYVTLAQLEAGGITAADVRRRCPGAVEYTDPDGRLYWRAEDLEQLLGDTPDGRADP